MRRRLPKTVCLLAAAYLVAYPASAEEKAALPDWSGWWGLESPMPAEIRRVPPPLKPDLMEQILKVATGDLKRARHESDRLQDAESLMYTLGKSHEALAPLCAFHEKRQRLIPVSEPAALAEQMSKQFSELQARVLVLLDLAKSLFHTTLQNETALAALPSEGGRTDG